MFEREARVCSSAKRENYVMRVLSVHESFECSREFRVVFESFEWCSRVSSGVREFRVVFESLEWCSRKNMDEPYIKRS